MAVHVNMVADQMGLANFATKLVHFTVTNKDVLNQGIAMDASLDGLVYSVNAGDTVRKLEIAKKMAGMAV